MRLKLYNFSALFSYWPHGKPLSFLLKMLSHDKSCDRTGQTPYALAHTFAREHHSVKITCVLSLKQITSSTDKEDRLRNLCGWGYEKIKISLLTND